MRLVDRLVEYGQHSGIVESRLRAGNVLLDDDGTLEQLAMAELMAQAFAAVRGYENMIQGRPPLAGYLVGIRKVAFLGSARLGDRLRITVTPLKTLGGYTVASGEVKRHHEVIAHGEIKVWSPEDH
jgi:predicted hotdog family 3-hydroxylacyl-ACP dehydratase